MIFGMTYKRLASYLATAIPGGMLLDSASQYQGGRLVHFLMVMVGVLLIQVSGAILWADRWE